MVFLAGTATSTWTSPNLGDINNRNSVQVLAGALYYARTGDAAMHTKVQNALTNGWQNTINPSNPDGTLAVSRQVGAYALSADLIGFNDSTFKQHLSDIRTKTTGAHGLWFTLLGTSKDSSNNWGAYATASMIAIDLYLKDNSSLQADYSRLKGFLGDGSSYIFRTPSGLESAWNCGTNPWKPVADCASSINGAISEDAERGNGTTIPFPQGDAGGLYEQESLSAIALSVELLTQNGYPDILTAGNNGLFRAYDFAKRANVFNQSSVGYYLPYMVNFRFPNMAIPTNSAGYGRIFGYTDWLYGGR